MSDTKTKGELFWTDVGTFGWLVRYEHSDTWMDFKAYEVVGENGNNGQPDDGARLYHRKGADRGEDMTTDPDAADELWGYVKWDGCCEFKWADEQPHFCGRADVASFAEVLTKLHALCLMLPSVDRDCAGYKDLPNGGDPK